MSQYEHPQTRFERFVDRRGESECWLWVGYVRPNGYGRFMVRAGKPVYAHRFAYELVKGAIPEGLSIDHLCRNRRCVNPSHLEAVTQRENLRRGLSRNRGKTHCPRGHPYDLFRKNGGRWCRECKNADMRERRGKLKPEIVS